MKGRVSFVDLIGKPCNECGEVIDPLELVIDEEGTVVHETQADEWGGHMFDYVATVDRAHYRESGGSIPAGVCPECQQSPCIGHPRAPYPPVLNKSGGSAVEGGDENCAHDWRDYFAHRVCIKCGAAQRGAAGG